MVEINIKYYSVKGKTGSHNVYTYLSVEGHANDGTINALKCCASITSVIVGFANCLNDCRSTIRLNNGLFVFKCYAKNYSRTTMRQLDLLICQLSTIQDTYPQFFKSFNVVKEY